MSLFNINVVHDNQMSEIIQVINLVPWISYQDRYKSAPIIMPTETGSEKQNNS